MTSKSNVLYSVIGNMKCVSKDKIFYFNMTVTKSIDGSGYVFLTGIFNFTPLYEQID